MDDKITPVQFKSLHLWFQLLANELQNQGLSMNGLIKYPIHPIWISWKNFAYQSKISEEKV